MTVDLLIQPKPPVTDEEIAFIADVDVLSAGNECSCSTAMTIRSDRHETGPDIYPSGPCFMGGHC
jgi:hypothetical protein